MSKRRAGSKHRTIHRKPPIREKDSRAQLRFIKPYLFSTVNRKLSKKQRLSRKQKEYIRDLYSEVSELLKTPHVLFKSRSKKKLTTAQQYARQNPELKGLRVAFIPTTDTQAKVVFTPRGNIKVKTHHIETEAIYWNVKALLRDPKKEIDRIWSQVPKGAAVQIIAGNHLIVDQSIRTKAKLIAEIKKLQNAYPSYVYDMRTGKRHKSEHDPRDWMLGIKVHTFQNQETWKEYHKRQMAEKRQAAKDRRKAKDKQRRQREATKTFKKKSKYYQMRNR